MVAIMLGADNGFFYAGQVMHFSGPFTVFLIYHKQCSNDLIIFRADGGNHFTHYGIYEGMFLIFDVSKDFKDGHLSCYLNNSGDDRPKFKVSDKPLDGYRHFGRLVASMKNYEV